MKRTSLLILNLLAAWLLVALTLACSGGEAAPSQAPSELEVAMSLYCSDLTLLRGALTLAGTDQGKQATADLEYANKLYADANRVEAAGDKKDAVKIRTMALALAIAGDARQKADADPALLRKTDSDAAAAIHDAPSCPKKG